MSMRAASLPRERERSSEVNTTLGLLRFPRVQL